MRGSCDYCGGRAGLHASECERSIGPLETRMLLTRVRDLLHKIRIFMRWDHVIRIEDELDALERVVAFKINEQQGRWALQWSRKPRQK